MEKTASTQTFFAYGSEPVLFQPQENSPEYAYYYWTKDTRRDSRIGKSAFDTMNQQIVVEFDHKFNTRIGVPHSTFCGFQVKYLSKTAYAKLSINNNIIVESTS